MQKISILPLRQRQLLCSVVWHRSGSRACIHARYRSGLPNGQMKKVSLERTLHQYDPFMSPLQTLLPLLALAGLLGFIALLLMRRGWRPARVGTTPHCARCDYIVGAIETARCPECGANLSLPGAVRHGERPVRRGLGFVGLFLGVLSLALLAFALTPTFQGIEWYQYAPLGWVLKDYQSQLNATSTPGWNELERRLSANKLTIKDQHRVIDAYLSSLEGDPTRISSRPGTVLLARRTSFTQEQKNRLFAAALTALQSTSASVRQAAEGELDNLINGNLLSPAQRQQIDEMGLANQKDLKSPANRWLMKHLGQAELMGWLSPEQRERFQRQCYDFTLLEVRRTVIQGDLVAYRWVTDGRGPETIHNPGSPTWWSGYKVKTVKLDGKTAMQGHVSGSGGGFGRATHGSSLPCNEPGKHKLEVDLELIVYYGSRDNVGEIGPVRWKRDVTLSQEFEVLPSAPADYIKWFSDPPADQMKKFITVQSVQRSTHGDKGIMVMIKVDSLPRNCGFEVLGRVDGKEHPISTISLNARSPTTYGFSSQKFPPTTGKMDLIFRSHERTVRQTPTMYEAWKGELVYENVIVDEK